MVPSRVRRSSIDTTPHSAWRLTSYWINVIVGFEERRNITDFTCFRIAAESLSAVIFLVDITLVFALVHLAQVHLCSRFANSFVSSESPEMEETIDVIRTSCACFSWIMGLMFILVITVWPTLRVHPFIFPSTGSVCDVGRWSLTHFSISSTPVKTTSLLLRLWASVAISSQRIGR